MLIPETMSAPVNTSWWRLKWNLLHRRTAYRRAVRGTVAAIWLFQLGAFLGLGVWILADGRFSEAVQDAHKLVAYVFRQDGAGFPAIASMGRVLLLGLTSMAVIVTLPGLIVGLLVGSPGQRRLHVWFALTSLVAGWLSLALGWPGLAWFGQQQRMRYQINSFEAVAEQLRAQWPNEDGTRPAVGSFLAYPQHGPSSLLMIAQPTSASHPSFSAVERGANGALRFELAGAEGGAWLEWHPPSSQPRSFVGGLRTPYVLVKSAQLAPNWYLTTYRLG